MLVGESQRRVGVKPGVEQVMLVNARVASAGAAPCQQASGGVRVSLGEPTKE
jgi:hypothetical protein